MQRNIEIYFLYASNKFILMITGRGQKARPKEDHSSQEADA